jgi:uncharacterized protein (TIRG00374 family)
MRALKIRISLRQSVLVFFAGLSLVVTPVGAGQVIKSRIVKKEFGDELSKTSPVVIIEAWSSLSSVLIILIFFFIFERFLVAEIIVAIGGIVALLFGGILKNQQIFSIFKRVLGRGRLKKFEQIVENSRSSCGILMNTHLVIEGFILAIPARMLEALCVFIIFKELGFKFDFILSAEIYFTSLVSGIMSFIPGGLFVTEGSMVGILVKYGYPLSDATAAVLLVRLSTIWFATILGLIIIRIVWARRKVSYNT